MRPGRRTPFFPPPQPANRNHLRISNFQQTASTLRCQNFTRHLQARKLKNKERNPTELGNFSLSVVKSIVKSISVVFL